MFVLLYLTIERWNYYKNVAILPQYLERNGKNTCRSVAWLRKFVKSRKAEELFLWIPRKMLMTVESAKNSVLGPVYTQDRILQAMGNITLAFHLLCERLNPNSFWLPYIKTLPMEYHTPLYFEEEEVHYLQSTQAIHDVFSQYKNTARQYAYFYKLIQTHPNASKLPLKESFTFDDYRWAVSSVMTRQNQIPTEDGSRVTLALIPLWDMCNHTNGLITTGYNLEDDRCECVALQDYKAKDQIYIFYGTRSNAEFVIHNGFFFDNNSHDRVKIKLGVSKSDRLYAMKAEVLARAGIPTVDRLFHHPTESRCMEPRRKSEQQKFQGRKEATLKRSSVFALHCSEPPISAQLLAFLRVFCMSEDELKEHLVGEHAIDKIFTLGNSDFPVSWDNEIKLWTFLETRGALLLKTYKTTTEDDRSLLEKPELSYHTKMAVQLRTAEKEILEKAVQSAATKREHFTELQDKGAPLPKYEESNIAMLENTATDSKIPMVLRNLNIDDEGEQDLNLTEALGKAIVEGGGIVNGESTFPIGTNPKDHENPEQEDNTKETGGTIKTISEKNEHIKTVEIGEQS
ncbi:actin-histidine N-methyltransferase [Rhincodon typus]|uniref:actin-histidine N-methyltransferase n=1 Tax=Rhincodon typus TaxID=259920 RepID=UPI00202F767A|nr:actin-histidine N-methyltransferase [Rhincodon typus]